MGAGVFWTEGGKGSHICLAYSLHETRERHQSLPRPPMGSPMALRCSQCMHGCSCCWLQVSLRCATVLVGITSAQSGRPLAPSHLHAPHMRTFPPAVWFLPGCPRELRSRNPSLTTSPLLIPPTFPDHLGCACMHSSVAHDCSGPCLFGVSTVSAPTTNGLAIDVVVGINL